MIGRWSHAQRVLAVLAVAIVALIAVELGLGAANEPGPTIANPCHARGAPSPGGIDATIQRIVLDGLDGAACRLHTTREELVLSLGVGHRRWSRQTIETALRAGMLRSVDEAERRGDIPAFMAPTLRELVRHAPLDQLIRGGLSLRNIFG